jgi:uncharacterized repeat protein (TIGR03803 family)
LSEVKRYVQKFAGPVSWAFYLGLKPSFLNSSVQFQTAVEAIDIAPFLAEDVWLARRATSPGANHISTGRERLESVCEIFALSRTQTSRISCALMLAVAAAAAFSLAACGSGSSSPPPPPTTYTVGGTVSGLSGTGLVLQDNGANNLSISQNGSFTFTAPVNNGLSYNVTVVSQPSSPAQNCVVTSGGGRSSVNITSVQVACTNLYTVGGTVSGLAGSGLVLLDNGSDGSPVAANGSFTFPIPLASGASYSVTISSQPSNPAQNCVVTNGNGTATANVTSVQVTCTTIVFYAIGGTVSGLASNTQVNLVDNGGDLLPVTTNGSFTFVTSIASGNAYSVTVSSQPFNAKCTVTNGSGTANGNVTNIQVACASKLKVLYSFGAAPDGSDPQTNLVFDGSGNLYGVTLGGGNSGSGVVYELSPANGPWTEKILYDFCKQANCADGGASHAALVFDTTGNLYGTTSQGGAYNFGVVFELAPQPNGTWKYSVLHSFGNGTDGKNPFGGVVFDSAGNLYGTTGGGGTTTTFCAGGCGMAYELSPGSGGQWTETVLYNFCSQSGCADGNAPVGSLVLDTAGNLYGATQNGGSPTTPSSEGTVFQLAPPTGSGQWTMTTLHSFPNDGGSDGYSPTGGLALTNAGASVVLYGTTEFGGCCGNNGLLYKLEQPSSGSLPWVEVPLYGFCGQCAAGSGPNAGLVLDPFGSVYGTTFNGGALSFAGGVVFMVTPTGTETTIYSFEGGIDGYSPYTGLIMDSAGNLYGVAQGGGANGNGNGVVFEVTP